MQGRAGVNFSDEQLDQAALWSAQLNRPRKRRGRGAEDEWEMPKVGLLPSLSVLATPTENNHVVAGRCN
jgi:hypothetical protein